MLLLKLTPFLLVFIKLESKINELVIFWFELALPEIIDRWLVRSVSRRYFFFFFGSLTPLRDFWKMRSPQNFTCNFKRFVDILKSISWPQLKKSSTRDPFCQRLKWEYVSELKVRISSVEEKNQSLIWFVIVGLKLVLCFFC